MFLSLTYRGPNATDLGYLLHKHPERVQSFPLNFGAAHVFYPVATAEQCQAVLLLDLDPVALVRGRSTEGRSPESAAPLAQYVNDRPYVASSFLSVAIRRVFNTAVAGHCEERPELVASRRPLEARCGPFCGTAAADWAERLFRPLGYQVALTVEQAPDLPALRCVMLTLSAETTLRELLTHLYVLIPVIDDDKHYWVGEEELEKLLRHGEGWLANHPEREAITRRYLRRGGPLARVALDRLLELADSGPESLANPATEEEEAGERRLGLDGQRLASVRQLLKESGATRVLDLGCGEGKLLRELLKEPQFTAIVGVDVDTRSLQRAAERLKLERLPERQRARLELLHSSLTYRDRRLAGYDAAAVVEVIEHLDPDRLPAFAAALFGCARPAWVVLTTPNREFNARFPNLVDGALRHRDHRFEWSRAEFAEWCAAIAARYDYHHQISGIGEQDPALGQPTQLVIFQRQEAASG